MQSAMKRVGWVDNEHLMTLLNDKIQTIEGVSRTETYISLIQQIKRQIQVQLVGVSTIFFGGSKQK